VARQLAGQGFDLVARREPLLRRLEDELRRQHGVQWTTTSGGGCGTATTAASSWSAASSQRPPCPAFLGRVPPFPGLHSTLLGYGTRPLPRFLLTRIISSAVHGMACPAVG